MVDMAVFLFSHLFPKSRPEGRDPCPPSKTSGFQILAMFGSFGALGNPTPSLFIPDHPNLAWVLRCTPEVRQKVYPTLVIVNGEPLI
jgi:hypothetical protein